MKLPCFRCLYVTLRQIHHYVAAGIPDLICKVPAGFHLLPVETHIISRSISGNKGKAESIRTVFVNNLKRIDTVPQGLTHLTALGIPYKTVNKHMVEWSFTGLLQPREHHSYYPEENNVIACNQHIRGIEVIKIRIFLGPSQGREGPQCR